jgi:hypothetical protein
MRAKSKQVQQEAEVKQEYVLVHLYDVSLPAGSLPDDRPSVRLWICN